MLSIFIFWVTQFLYCMCIFSLTYWADRNKLLYRKLWLWFLYSYYGVIIEDLCSSLWRYALFGNMAICVVKRIEKIFYGCANWIANVLNLFRTERKLKNYRELRRNGEIFVKLFILNLPHVNQSTGQIKLFNQKVMIPMAKIKTWRESLLKVCLP